MPTSSSNLRIAHAGDIHMGAGYAHGIEDSSGVNARLEDFRASWMKACRQMVDRRVQILLFAGDAYRDGRPSQTEQAAFFGGLLYLTAAGVEVVGVDGNHDSPRQVGRSSTLEVLKDFRGRPAKFYRTPGVAAVQGLAIAHFPWTHRAHAAAKIPEFDKLSIDDQSATILDLQLQALRGIAMKARAFAAPYGYVLLGHAGIAEAEVGAGVTQYFREPLLPVNELAGLGFSYQAWGHYHRAQILRPGIAYSGSIDRVDFNEAKEDKGWWYLEIEEGGTLAEHEFVSVGARPFVDLELIELEKYRDLRAFRANLDDTVRDAIVRVKYTASEAEAQGIDDAGIKRVLLEAGARCVHGPFATIIREEKTGGDITQDDDPLEAWREYCRSVGRDQKTIDDLEPLVLEALGVTSES